MAKKIVITSGKGGVGKTTVAVNLGRILSSCGASVVIVDVDFGLNNIDVVMGVENKVVYDMLDIFEGRCRVRQALVQDNYRSNLYVLPSNKINVLSEFSGQNIKLILESLSPVFDYVLIDCPAGIDYGFHRAVSCADSALLITTPNLPSIRDASKVVTILNSYKLDSVGLVVNRARGDLMIDEKMMSPYDISKVLKTKLVGVLPEEDTVFLSSGYSIPKKTESYKAYKLLSKFIMQGDGKIYDASTRYSGFLGSIKRNLKRKIWKIKTMKLKGWN